MQILDPNARDVAPSGARILMKTTWDSVIAGKRCGHRHRSTATAEKCARERLNERRAVRLNSRDDCSQYVAPGARMAGELRPTPKASKPKTE